MIYDIKTQTYHYDLSIVKHTYHVPLLFKQLVLVDVVLVLQCNCLYNSVTVYSSLQSGNTIVKAFDSVYIASVSGNSKTNSN